ncbi:DUF488 domain-containing protein [Actinomadura sp. 7K507]|uniref:DUF488 domain-containing protein n=1 Tax=Actinomadura sp. 7K507 TaxID=2530365 RepID=UPI00104E9FFB|nr:DUF488 domain-containing protein [Actinomadura sp. 7K507]TDC79242.1 DUF488 domain-containing protein [Actinomadura sp. 7K507]
MTSRTIYTVGHSTHSFAVLQRLLRKYEITAIADVRSVPASRFAHQFNRDILKRALHEADIKYVFLGEELGARSNDPACYLDGRVQYRHLARTPEFARGIERLLNGAQTERIAIMCTEQEPLDCHRTILVARVIEDHGISIEHIHSDGHLESQAMAMRRLMAKFDLAEDDLFNEPAKRLKMALSRQEQRIAYVRNEFRVDGAEER